MEYFNVIKFQVFEKESKLYFVSDVQNNMFRVPDSGKISFKYSHLNSARDSV